MGNLDRFYITTPIYYVNAKPHLGHAYTTIAADVFAQYYGMKLHSNNVYFLTGTDEHGAKIHQKAESQNKTAQELCDEVSAEFKLAWEKLEIEHHDFIRTTQKRHTDFVKDFIVTLKENDALYESEYEGLYCVGCEKFITEKDLEDGVCPDHNAKPEVIKEKNWFFNLAKYLPQVKELIEKDEIIIKPEHAKKEVLGLFKQGVPDFSVTRRKEKVQWGIEVPWDDSQLIYVWCDALTNYISAVQTDDMQKSWWPASMQLLAKDILKFHAIFWPAMLLAAGYETPKELFIHGFFTSNGKKMSKTLGNVIDPVEMVDDFGVDATKYLLLSQFPFGYDGDIDKDNFDVKYNADLANGLGNLFNRVITLAIKNYNSQVPKVILDSPWKDDIEKAWHEYENCLENTRRLDGALHVIMSLVQRADKQISDLELWKLIKEDAQKGGMYIYELLEVLRHVALMVRPFMKNTSDLMLKQLGVIYSEQQDFNTLKQWGQLEQGTQLEKIQNLFDRRS